MSERDSVDENVPHEPAEEEESSEHDDEIEAEPRPAETESRDSGHESPLEGAGGCSRDSGLDSPLEGAVGGVLEGNDVRLSPGERSRIKSGKEDLFRKFFSKEYEQVRAPILGRHRHSARRQRVRQRHSSEDSKLSDPNPLGCLQDAGTSSGPVLNQAGAIIGKDIPREDVPEYQRFGTEFGQSLPLTPRIEGSERSVSSIGTALIGEIYGGTFSRPTSDDSRELSPGSSFPSFSSRPETSASDNLKTSPPDSESPEGEKRMSPTPADSESLAHGKPVRQRRFGVVTDPIPIRSKSALAGSSAYCTNELSDGEAQARKLSKDMSVCSEPLPERKISKDSSVDYYEQMSLEDETIHYPELSHSIDSDSCLPMPDIDPVAVQNLSNNVDALAISLDTSTEMVEQNGQESENEGQNTATAENESPDADVSQ